jgi:hypothetical protein
MTFTPELIAYLILGLVDKLGSADAARAEIDSMKTAGKSFDEILDTLEAERLDAAAEAHGAVDKLPG